mgnify:CR=1 FL=1
MAKLIRLDIINGNPRSFVAPAKLEQGLFLEIVGKAENVDLGVDPDYEAYEVELADAETERGQLLLHASVANQYDERLSEVDFVLPKGKVGRGYQPVMGDIVTIAAIAGVEVGDELALGADGLLVDASGTNAIAVVEALEDITIPEAEPQKSMVIRFL